MKIVRNKEADRAFKRRYNRIVYCETGKKLNDNGTLQQSKIIITTESGKSYTIDEFLQGNRTDYVIVSYEDVNRRFNKFLDAEVFVADQLGKEN